MLWRKDSIRNITENFGYDLFDQLKWSKVTGQDSLKMNYDDIGNITFKSDVGTYYYNSTKIHAVDSISGSQYPGRQNIEYNFFNKPVYIADAEDSLNYIYNVHDDRIKATLYGTGGLDKTTWYAGLYEKTVENSTTKQYYYINSPEGPIALFIQTDGVVPDKYYICKDHLGSITGILASNTSPVAEFNYDAWGRRRNPTNWSYTNVPTVAYTNRGFTGHEHLDMFNLINMNGRVYDSEIARFISPDPIIQDPYNILSYNRYTYCLNNPLKYTDPSGYLYNPGFNSRMWQLIASLWNRTPQGEDLDFTPDGSGGWQGVRSGSGFQGPNMPYMLGEVTVASKAPVKNVKNQDNPNSPLIEFRDRIINGNIARFLVKDYYSFSLDGSVVPGFGGSVSAVSVNILLRGHEKGIFLTHVPSNSLGLRGGFNISAQQGTFMGDPNNITRNSLYGLTWSLDSDFPIFPFGAWMGFDPNNQIVWRGTSSSLGFSYGVSLNRSWVNPGLPK